MFSLIFCLVLAFAWLLQKKAQPVEVPTIGVRLDHRPLAAGLILLVGAFALTVTASPDLDGSINIIFFGILFQVVAHELGHALPLVFLGQRWGLRLYLTTLGVVGGGGMLAFPSQRITRTVALVTVLAGPVVGVVTAIVGAAIAVFMSAPMEAVLVLFGGGIISLVNLAPISRVCDGALFRRQLRLPCPDPQLFTDDM